MGYIDHHCKDQEEGGRNLFRCWTGKAGYTQARPTEIRIQVYKLALALQQPVRYRLRQITRTV